MKRIILITLMMAMCHVSPYKALAIDLPGDMPTIEALISLHKLIKSEEDDAMARIATSFGEQSLVTKGAKAFNDVRATLDSKLNNAYSYVLFAAALSGTANSLYKLINEYSKFTQSTASTAFSKPMVAWYYAEANLACARELKNIRQMYLTLSSTGLNVMKASMDEKMTLIYALRSYIDNMLRIIDQAYVWCSIVAVGGFHYDYIWDILNSEVTDEIAEGVISIWNES